MFDDDWGPRDHWARSMRRWAHDFGRQWGGWDRRERVRERIFARGDLKYVILDLLRERPRHGYDIIRELEDRFGGFYTPSAGVVYPTLQMLEDMGAVISEQQDGRKTYTITDEGRRILEQRHDVVDEVADRFRRWMHGGARTELQEAMRETGDLIALLGRESGRLWNDPEKLKAVRDAISRTRAELEDILHPERRQAS